jgi:hypothetical protein
MAVVCRILTKHSPVKEHERITPGQTAQAEKILIVWVLLMVNICILATPASAQQNKWPVQVHTAGSYGKLGLGTACGGLHDTADRHSPVAIADFAGEKSQHCPAGGAHTICVTQSGTLFIEFMIKPTDHVLLIKVLFRLNPGSVFSWGYCSFGACGHGMDHSEQINPKRIEDFGGVKQCSVIPITYPSSVHYQNMFDTTKFESSKLNSFCMML